MNDTHIGFNNKTCIGTISTLSFKSLGSALRFSGVCVYIYIYIYIYICVYTVYIFSLREHKRH